jgi:hypothetical protein
MTLRMDTDWAREWWAMPTLLAGILLAGIPKLNNNGNKGLKPLAWVSGIGESSIHKLRLIIEINHVSIYERSTLPYMI